jgi:putative methyltransferase (TIGR04325 family)
MKISSIKKIGAKIKKKTNLVSLKSIDAHEFNHGYESSELIKIVIEKNLQFRQRLKLDNLEFKEQDMRILTYLSLVPEKSQQNVLDFGGGGGGNLEAIVSKFLPHRKFTWKVVETESMAVAASSSLKKENISWVSEIPRKENSKCGFDIVIASSSIQYTKDPIKTLMELVALKSRYIVLSRTPLFCNNRTSQDYIQESWLLSNGPGETLSGVHNRIIKYPICIPNMSEVELLLSEDYEILLKLFEGDVSLNGIPEKLQYYGYIAALK